MPKKLLHNKNIKVFCSVNDMETNNDKAQAIANEVKKMVMELQRMGRTDLLLRAISVPVLEELRIEAAKTSLSRLRITSDYHFILTDYGKEVIMTPVHKALYLFSLIIPKVLSLKTSSTTARK